MIRKINAALITANIALASYLVMKLDFPVIVYAYFVLLTGFYFARWAKEAVLLCCAISVFCAIKFMRNDPESMILSCVLFLCCAAVPYYFSMKAERVKREFSQRNCDIKNKRDKTLSSHSGILADKRKFEEEFERIMQFYIFSREFSRNIGSEGTISVIRKIFANKAGVSGLCVFNRERSKWICVYCEPPFLEKQWIKHIDSIRDLSAVQEAGEIEKPDFCPKNETAVFIPLKIQNEILGGIVIACEKDYAERYVLEGRIFSPQISLSVKRLKLMNEVNSKAISDGLTGLYRRGHFIERLQGEIEREKRYPKGFFIMMLDIDWFKKVNDKFGHLTGDRVLVSVAKILSDSSGFGTFAGRYGGEEFIIFVPVSEEKEALAIAGEINKSVAAKKYKSGEEIFKITVSIGLSGFPQNGATGDELISAADQALYKAKESGRNKVVIYRNKSLRRGGV
jgi:diguanylate cyclase (GGDEF)-like protein